MKTVCIVQARRRSTRLPDKILKPLGNKLALQQNLLRCQAIKGVDEVICAGVDDPYEDPVRKASLEVGVKFFPGDEYDAISRYYYAAKESKADIVMRVTSDCPLLDPGVSSDLLEFFKASKVDYATNPGFPHGLDCEVFYFDKLEEAHFKAKSSVYREHVSLWIAQDPDVRVGLLKAHIEDLNLKDNFRWVLDYPEDYDFLSQLFQKLGNDKKLPTWIDVLKILKENPELQKINRHCGDLWKEKDNTIRQESQDNYDPSKKDRIRPDDFIETIHWTEKHKRYKSLLLELI